MRRSRPVHRASFLVRPRTYRGNLLAEVRTLSCALHA